MTHGAARDAAKWVDLFGIDPGYCEDERPSERVNRVYGLTPTERLSLAERIRIAFDTPPEQRVIQDTWLYAAAMAEQWYVDRANSVTPPAEGDQ